MASECQKLAVRLFRRPEKAVQRNFFLEFSEIGSVNIIRDIGDIDGIQLQNPKQCVVKGILGARPFSGPVLFRLVKPFLYNLDIIITEILPEQFIYYFLACPVSYSSRSASASVTVSFTRSRIHRSAGSSTGSVPSPGR